MKKPRDKKALRKIELRKYQRYAMHYDGDTLPSAEVKVEGERVRLVDFSLGGLLVLSKVPFSPGAVSFSVNFENRGIIALDGTVVRVSREGDMWAIAIDLSKTYDLNSIRKV